LDKKDVFSYKTANSSGAGAGDELALSFQKFKESFNELVYRFPHTYYLTDACVNNCVEYYLQRKLLPCFSYQAIDGIKKLLEKYFSIQNCQNVFVRKFVLEALTKKLHEYNKFEQKSFAVSCFEFLLGPFKKTTGI